MKAPRWRTSGAAVATLGLALACAACGSTAAPGPARATAPVLPAAGSLAYSAATDEATWASLPMGASSGPNEFWQLFALPRGQRQWKLETPPDIATNGALELAGLAGRSLVVGVRPSLYLAFSPVTMSDDAGSSWTAGPPAPGLAAVPDGLAATTGDGRLLALSTTGQVMSAALMGHSWTPLTTRAALTVTSVGRACDLGDLTAVAYSAVGRPLVAGSCRQPGVAGIFERLPGGWQRAAMPLPAALRDSRVTVIRLVSTSRQTTALLLAQAGGQSELAAAFLDGSGSWTMSAPVNLGSAGIRSSAFSSAGGAAVVLSTGRAAIITGPAGSWRLTPVLPAGRAVIVALPAPGQTEALTATAGTLAVWRLSGDRWAQLQTIKVPIPYGSSS